MSEFWDPKVPKRKPDGELTHEGHLFQAWRRRGDVQVVVRSDESKKSPAIREISYPKAFSTQDALAVAKHEWRHV